MLSYAEHGKFRAPTQGRQGAYAIKRRRLASIWLGFCKSASQVDHGANRSAMVDPLSAAPAAARRRAPVALTLRMNVRNSCLRQCRDHRAILELRLH
jgi:hypothetical protein